jgi:DNA polymerase-1
MTELVLVDSVTEVEAFLRWLSERRPILAFDLETSGLDPYRDVIRLAQFGDAETGWAIPYRDWRGVVRHALEIYDRPLGSWNGKFDVSFLERDGLTVDRHLVHDGMTMAHLFDSHGPKALKPAANFYLASGSDQSQVMLKEAMKHNGWDWATVPETFETYWLYGAMDTVLTARVIEHLWPKIQPYRDAYDLERDVTWVLLDMEQRGARIDPVYCEKQYEELTGELEEIRARWPGLDILSTTQIRMQLEAEGFASAFTKKTEKGNIAVDDEVLARIDHPLAQDCRRARQCSKWTSSYFGAFLRYAVDDIVHCNVNPLGAEKTGRMSISRPSMQNLPRLKLVRDAFIPRDGNRIVLTDYQAQETRLIAHFANEAAMIAAFHAGVDIHRFVAEMVYKVATEAVTPDQRYRAKTCGHARNYGANAEKLAFAANIGLAEGRGFVERYDAAFPGIPVFNAKVVHTVYDREEDGYGHLMSYGGRKIRVPVSKAYAGTNWLVQGSGSDALKKGLVNADRMGIAQFAVLPEHDEVVWDIPIPVIDEVLPEIHEAFEHDDLAVPLPIEEKIVERWGDAYV